MEELMMKRSAAIFATAALLFGGADAAKAETTVKEANSGKVAKTTETKFYCNLNALSPSERAHHKRLTGKLIAARNEVVETKTGYEFQYSPTAVSLAELSEWVLGESKCCPFFDFHLDFERAGTLLCLRLTGAEGIKRFILDEFHVPINK
jgi:hypothetical protein